MKQKAQVALEFLMTYGWALLIVGVSVGVLGYLLITPQEFVQPSCNFIGGLECIGHRFTTSNFSMEVSNNEMRGIQINLVQCTLGQDTTEGNANPESLSTGATSVITCNPVDVTENEFINIKVVVYYTLDGQTYPKTSEANVIGYVISS
jgi:hypothetical protein